jgi:hypothetical protein
MAVNREWHMKNRMPKNATFGQRVAWHTQHMKYCTCAPIPEKLAEEMKKKGIPIPDRRFSKAR